MSFVRRLSTRRLLTVIAASAVLVIGGAAIAIAASGGGTPPPAKRLPAALRDALRAPAVAGVTARIRFTNELVSSDSLPGGTPLLTGAEGRLWASPDGRVRLELQSDRGDAQVLVDGRRVSVYDASSRTQYRATLPPEKGDRAAAADRRPGVPTIRTIARALGRAGREADISAATPTTVAGRPAYSVRVAPRNSGGLLGGAEVAWDAENGTPLRIGVYAAGRQDPVLQLAATEISFGAVDPSVYDVATPPPGTRIVDVTPDLNRAARAERRTARSGRRPARPVTGVAAVQSRVTFPVSAPGTLAGLPRTGVRLLRMGKGETGAVVTYGKGLGAIAVVQTPVAAGDTGQDPLRALPEVSIGGATGHELPTALGTILTFTRDGVRTTVIGSVPPAAAEAAARGL